MDDSAGLEAKFDSTIPFDFESAFKRHFYDQSGIDYAFIRLRPYYRNLLETNGIVALDEKAWRIDIPMDFDAYWMLGVANETVASKPLASGLQLRKGYSLLHIDPINNPPKELETEQPRFYGTISDGQDIPQSIVGTSGGPIFGCKKNADGGLQPWVVALQSGWLASTRTIAACPILDFAEWIDEQITNATQISEECDWNAIKKTRYWVSPQ